MVRIAAKGRRGSVRLMAVDSRPNFWRSADRTAAAVVTGP
jgi:hypothetical protein